MQKQWLKWACLWNHGRTGARKCINKQRQPRSEAAVETLAVNTPGCDVVLWGCLGGSDLPVSACFPLLSPHWRSKADPSGEGSQAEVLQEAAGEGEQRTPRWDEPPKGSRSLSRGTANELLDSLELWWRYCRDCNVIVTATAWTSAYS